MEAGDLGDFSVGDQASNWQRQGGRPGHRMLNFPAHGKGREVDEPSRLPSELHRSLM